jgi:hypothetical protein
MTTGFFGKGMTFSGSSQYLTCTDAVCGGTTIGLDPGSGSWSVGAWVKTTTASRQMIVSKGSSTGQFAYSLESGRNSSDGKPEFILFNTSDSNYIVATGTTAISDGKWHYILGTYDGTTATIYIDGVSSASSSSKSGTQVTDSTGDFFIGSRGAANYWTGSIDEVFVERRALTADEVAELYRGGSNHRISRTITSTDLSAKKRLPFWIAADRPGIYLESTFSESTYVNNDIDSNVNGLWRMEEVAGSGAYLKDSSGFGNHATPTGTSSMMGKVGKARNFSGSEYLTVSDSNSLDITTNFSLEAWVYPTSVANAVNQIFIKNSANTNFYGLYVSNSQFVGCQISGVTGSGTINARAIPLNQWSHVVCTYDGANIRIYVNGMLDITTAATGSTTASAASLDIGRDSVNASRLWTGALDEIKISNAVRTADQIRQAFEIGRRTHPITIDFAATLDSGNLISNSGDLSFTINGQSFGAMNKGDNLYYGDTILIKENYNGTDYIAQGVVNAVTPSTGAVTVAAWNGGSTFPSGGFTTGASVFKWQREYWDITGSLSTQRDAIAVLTLRPTDGSSGRNVYIDDLNSAGDYLSTPGGSTITSLPFKRYFQYRTIFSSWDTNVSPSLVSATVNYNANTGPTTPTLDSPFDKDPVKQSRTPALKTTATDAESDYLRYKIELCTDVAMTANCQTFNQVSSQTGWSGQNTQTSTAYTSGTQATYTIQTALEYNTTYYWRSYAIDPAGTNAFSSTQSPPYSFTTILPDAPPSCTLTKNNTNTSITVNWTDIFTGEDGFTIQRNTDNGGFSALTTAAANATSVADNTVSNGHTYQYRVRETNGTAYSDWCTTSTLSLQSGLFHFEGVSLEGLNVQ